MDIPLAPHRTLRLTLGDITQIPADAIVNAANSALRGGGGVDGAIHRAAGPSLMRELDVIRARQGGCPTGSAVVTSAGHLPARFVFHAVGPVYRDGRHGEPEALASCYRTAMELAEQHQLRSISFPAISAGIYGYPLPEAARIALTTVAQALQSAQCVQTATFVLFNQQIFDVFAAAARSLLPTATATQAASDS